MLMMYMYIVSVHMTHVSFCIQPPGEMGAVGKAPRLVHVWGAKLMGATMWCWILWRFKHDWRDVLVCIRGVAGPTSLVLL